MKIQKICLFLLLVLVGTSVQASELSYSFIEGDYIMGNSPNREGYAIRGSLAIGKNWYVLGDVASIDDVDSYYGTDFKLGRVGLGFHTSMSDNADFFVDASYTYRHVENCYFYYYCYLPNDHGYRTKVGARASFGKHFEGSLAVAHTSFDMMGGETRLLVGGQWKWSQRLGLTAEVEAGEERLYSLGVRASF